MDKKLTRTDYVFAVTFIFMLVAALGAFFLGMKLGNDRATVKYEELLTKQNEENQTLSAYHQQYLVSFYHTVYQPYREFHQSWFETMNALTTEKSSDHSLALKDLAKKADSTYTELENKSMPDSSPLLKEALTNYLKGLKVLSEGLRKQASAANSLTGPAVVKTADGDAFIAEGKRFILLAEKSFYGSIVKWHQNVNPKLTIPDYTKSISSKQWQQLSLNVKNDYVAHLMASSNLFEAYAAQDMTVRIDEMLHSGQAEKLKLTSLPQLIDLLTMTSAVRSGDYLLHKKAQYDAEVLPQLPFFSE